MPLTPGWYWTSALLLVATLGLHELTPAASADENANDQPPSATSSPEPDNTQPEQTSPTDPATPVKPDADSDAAPRGANDADGGDAPPADPAEPVEPAEPAAPDDAAPADPDAALIKQLSHPGFGQREDAYFKLLRLDDVDEARMLKWMDLADSLEARHRVLSAAQHHVLRNFIDRHFAGQEHGSVGLTQQVLLAEQAPDVRRAAVLVVMTFPGFPAYAHLKPGDMIIRFNGQDIPEKMDVDMFRDMVQQHRNGDRVTLVAIRQGKPIELAFELGSFEALRRMYQHNDRSLQPPFRDAWHKTRDKLLDAVDPTPRERIE